MSVKMQVCKVLSMCVEVYVCDYLPHIPKPKIFSSFWNIEIVVFSSKREKMYIFICFFAFHIFIAVNLHFWFTSINAVVNLSISFSFPVVIVSLNYYLEPIIGLVHFSVTALSILISHLLLYLSWLDGWNALK